MNIVIYGTGGVGGYFGTRLSQAGFNVTFIDRGEHLKAIQQHGLQLKSIKGDYRVNPAQAMDNMVEVKNPALIILAVKSWQAASVSKTIQPYLRENTIVLPLLNGVSNIDAVLSKIPKKHVLGGFCKIFSKIEAPGIIHHMSMEPFIAFGELDNRQSERISELKTLFEKAEISHQVPEDIHVAIWSKFLFITTISAIGALTRSSLGVMRTMPEVRKIMEDTAQEILTIALAKKVQLTQEHVKQCFEFIDSLPFETTASLQRDIMEGRPSELEAQVGTIHRLGLEFNLPTRVNTFLYHCLLPQENQVNRDL